MAESGGDVMIGYMIKGVNDKLQGYNRFQYPKKGEVVAPDWNPEPKCKGGIFGCTEGAWGYNFTNHSHFLVLSYKKGTEVKVENDKIKVPKAKVLKVFNDLQKAIAFFEQKSGLIYCGHKVLQVVWHEGNFYTESRDWDGKKYKLEVIDNKLTIEECTND